MQLVWVAPNSSTITFSTDENETFKFLLGYTGFSTAPVWHGITNAPYQDGSTCIDTKMKPREIGFDVMVQTLTLDDQQVAIQNLLSALNPLTGDGHLLFTKEDGSTYSLHCRGNGDTITLSPAIRSPTSQLARIEMIAHDPFWYGSPPQIIYFDSSTPLTFPFAFDFALPRNDTTQSLWNWGNVASPVTINISGEIENPVLENLTTGDTITFDIDMAAGDKLVVTTAFGNKTAVYTPIGTGIPESAFKYLDPDSVFWQLQPLENIVELSYDSIAASAQVSILWEDRYSGI